MSIVIAVIIFSLLIFFHELGHFLLAKKNGIRVVEFSIGFGPRLFSFEKGDTRYSIKLFFFGGACQMLSEDFFEEDEIEKDTEHSFENKSVWARIAVVAAGPVFNFILAWILAVVVMGSVGYDKPVINYVEPGSAAADAGLVEGDLIKELNGEKITFGREISLELYINPVTQKDVKLVYEREGKRYTANITPKYVERYALGISYMADENAAELSAVTENSPFETAGGKAGDVIVGIDGTAIATGMELKNYFDTNEISEETVEIQILRDGKGIQLSVQPVLGSAGYSMGLSYNLYRYETNALETIRYSFAEIKFQIMSVFKSLGMLFKGQLGVQDFTGPVGIVDIIGEAYDSSISEGIWMAFLNVANMVVLLSANLGVMNLLPIPGVDGGRLVFLFYEVIFRRRVPKKFEGVVTAVSMLLLMAFAVFVMYQDITKLL